MNHPSDNRRADNRSASRRGLSLIEMLVTIALLGIMAALVLPYFNAQIPSQLTGVAQIVAADIDYARNLAVANGSNYRLTLEPDDNRYYLHHVGANTLLNVLPPSAFGLPGDPPNHQTTDLDEMPLSEPRVVLLGAEATRGSAVRVDKVEFTSLGGTVRSQETVLWLACGEGDARRFISIGVSPVTGLTEIGDVQAVVPAIDEP